MNQSKIIETESELNAPNALSVCSQPEESLEITDEISVDNFVRCVEGGIKCWLLAGQMLVDLRKKDESIFSKLCAKAPWLSVDTLWCFHRIGEGKLYPQVMLMRKCPAEAELIAADLPTQKRLCEAPIDVVVAIKYGKPVTQKRWVKELGKESTEVVFKNGIVRSLPEQTEKLIDMQEAKAKAKAKANDHTPSDLVSQVLSDPAKAMKQRQIRSIGHYAVSWEKGEPKLIRLRSYVRGDAQQVTLSETHSAIIELRQWVETQ